MKIKYVATEDNDMIYEISQARIQDAGEGNYNYIVYSLELVAGKDYPTDIFNVNYIAWCSPEYFVSDAQYDTLVQYYETETLNDVLEENGLHPVDSLPSRIYPWKD